MLERGLHVDHTTIYRWVQRYAPDLEKRCRPHLKACNDSWRVDETYVKVKKTWMYLYRAVDSEVNTLDFLLSPTRDAEAAKRFFLKALHSTASSVSLTPTAVCQKIERITGGVCCTLSRPFRVRLWPNPGTYQRCDTIRLQKSLVAGHTTVG